MTSPGRRWANFASTADPIPITEVVIAAMAIEHGLPVVTQDGDFTRMAEAYGSLSVVRV